MGKYIPWWLFGKKRKEAANNILASAWNNNDAEDRVIAAIKAGADPNFSTAKLSLSFGKEKFTKRQIEILRDDIDKSENMRHREILESTELPLYSALKTNNLAIVSLLINAGATITDEILNYAIDKYQDEPKESYQTEVAELILNTAKNAGIYEVAIKRRNDEIEFQRKAEEKRKQEELEREQEELERKQNEEIERKQKELERKKIIEVRKIKLREQQEVNKNYVDDLLKTMEDKKTTSCGFCNESVSSDEISVGLIKGEQFLTEFEDAIGKKHDKLPIHFDPKSDEPLYFACPMCLLQYQGICTGCGSPNGGTKVILRSEETGKETPGLLCPKCFGKLMTSGGSFGGIR